MLSLINQAELHLNNIAIIDGDKSYTYQQLLISSQNFASLLCNDAKSLDQKRVAFLLQPGMDYVMVQWAIWQAGGIAVPLNPKAPIDVHRYVIEDATVDIIVTSPVYRAVIEALTSESEIRLLTSDMMAELTSDLPNIAADRAAMILYTSGTTAAPKGVVSTHDNIEAQAKTLVDAWEWSATDHIVNVLPMHHVHGIINILTCALRAGATCEFIAFKPKALLDKLCQPEVTLFMAVPTIYYKLIAYWESCDQSEQIKISAGLKTLRLMVSGSAALPVSVLENWKIITGHTLLERYGMTEVGMAISNPYIGERRPGHIGLALPGVELRLVDEEMHDVQIGEQGEILVKGANVFKEYWNKPEATDATFTNDGWFKTGDIALINEGYYKIIGRSSIDIIKSGGYKLSALEIEEVLRSYPGISDCGVVGIPDEEWGELVAAALIIDGDSFTESELILWLSDKLPRYKIPTVFRELKELPRNAMGKVVKKELKEILNHRV